MISNADIERAGPILGVAHTDAERALLVPALEAALLRMRARRATAIPEDLAPATVFDPSACGARPPAPRPPAPPPPPAPFTGDAADLAVASLADLGAWLRARHISARELAAFFLARIARLDGGILAFARTTPETALRQADEADRAFARGLDRGPLHGIPYGCKDIIDTAGIVTDWGAEPYRGRTPARDATIVSRLAASGAVLLGKTSVGALAYGDLWYGGRTRNPWNMAEGSSGSSAGSAAAVAAGLCPVAVGTETLGSIVSPATRCRVLGLRPSFGRIPRTGAMPLCWSFDKIGFLLRHAADGAALLAAATGADAADPSSRNTAFAGMAGVPAGLRLGYRDADFPGGAPPLPGAVPVPIALPALPYESLKDILFAEAAAAFEPLTLSDRDDLLARQDADAWPNQFRAARFLSAVDHIQLDRLRRQTCRAMAAVFETADILATPSASDLWLVIGNATGLPALALPGGITLIGRLDDEALLLAVAATLPPAALALC